MDVNDIKAGKYQLVAIRWDQITSKPNEPLDYVRHRRGDIVDLTAEDAKRLVAAGAVVKPGELARTKAEQARAVAERAAADYQAILAGLPEDVRKEVAPGTVANTGSGTASGTGSGSQSGQQSGQASQGPTVEDILKDVGSDAEKAKAALTVETGEDGKNRSSLVPKLEAIIAKAEQGSGQS